MSKITLDAELEALWEQVRDSPVRTSTVELRCGVCRNRDWQRGGAGRADLLGWARVALGLEEPHVTLTMQKRTGRDELARRRREIGKASGRRSYLDESRRRPVPGENTLTPTAAKSRAKCRRGHRLTIDLADVLVELARGKDRVDLPAA